EARDRLPGAAHLRALSGDRGQLVHRRVEDLRLGLRLADAHVERDLRDRRDLHDRREVELFLQLRPQLALIALLEPRHVAVPVLLRGSLSRHYLSISWPQSARRHVRMWTSSPLISLIVMPMRVGRWQTGHTTITFPTGSGAALSITPPGMIEGPPLRLAPFTGFGGEARSPPFVSSPPPGRSAGPASSPLPCFPPA